MKRAGAPAAKSWLARAWRCAAALDERGAEAIEMAIVLPVFLVFLLGALDVGRMAWTQGTLDYATAAAARCAVVDPIQCSTVAQIESYGAAHAYGMTVDPSAFAVASDACGQRVSVSLPFQMVTPYVVSANFTLAANACYPSQS
jgi:hypothetical protein